MSIFQRQIKFKLNLEKFLMPALVKAMCLRIPAVHKSCRIEHANLHKLADVYVNEALLSVTSQQKPVCVTRNRFSHRCCQCWDKIHVAASAQSCRKMFVFTKILTHKTIYRCARFTAYRCTRLVPTIWCQLGPRRYTNVFDESKINRVR